MHFVKITRLSPKWGKGKAIKTHFVRKLLKRIFVIIIYWIFIRVKITSFKFSRWKEDVVLSSIRSANTRCTYKKAGLSLFFYDLHLKTIVVRRANINCNAHDWFFFWMKIWSLDEETIAWIRDKIVSRWRDSPHLKNVSDIVNNS